MTDKDFRQHRRDTERGKTNMTPKDAEHLAFVVVKTSKHLDRLAEKVDLLHGDILMWADILIKQNDYESAQGVGKLSDYVEAIDHHLRALAHLVRDEAATLV
jgi:hypothetical protein